MPYGQKQILELSTRQEKTALSKLQWHLEFTAMLTSGQPECKISGNKQIGHARNLVLTQWMINHPSPVPEIKK
jgi:hypothetical protein